MRRDTSETRHGVVVADPYQWLEERTAEVEQWVEAQNARLEASLAGLGYRQQVWRRLQTLLQLGHVTRPVVRRLRPGAFRYFYTRREGEEDQARLLVRDRHDGADRVLFDPARGRSPSQALDWFYPSHDGTKVAFGTSALGSEQSKLRVIDVETRQELPDVIARTAHASVAWKAGARSFYYTRQDPAASEDAPSGIRRVYEHALGTDSTLDPVVFGTALAPADFAGCATSPDGRWLVVVVYHGFSSSSLYLADTSRAPLSFRPIDTRPEHLYRPIAQNDRIYVLTDEKAPRYCLLALDPLAPSRESWRSVLAEHPRDVLEDAAFVGSNLLATYFGDEASRLECFDASGSPRGPIQLPAVGTSHGASGAPDSEDAFFDFESPVRPPDIHRVDLSSGTVETWAAPPSSSLPDVELETAHATSRDGTRVPYVLVRPHWAATPGPTVLYGYGGFGMSLKPRFSPLAAALGEYGVTWVQANLRGGGERGRDFHHAGRREHKQNVFDDYLAVATDLVRRGVTSPSRLAAYGRSNGGLLVTAAITQRPDLFRAAVACVPLTDMLRYDRFLLGALWTDEYGSPDDPEAFEWLRQYSPYHRVRPGTRYPAVLLTTGAHDSRVHPMHARKMAAALADSSTSGHPVLLRSDRSTGHGAGSSARAIAKELADIAAFILWQLDVPEIDSAAGG